MSERYGPCNACGGSGFRKVLNKDKKLIEVQCSACMTTGFSGNAMLKYQQELDDEWHLNQCFERNYFDYDY